MRRSALAFCRCAIVTLAAAATPAAAHATENRSYEEAIKAAAASLELTAPEFVAVEAAPIITAALAPEIPVQSRARDLIVLFADQAIVGIASFYDEPQETASGEQYDPHAFTAAAQLEIRDRFGGIQYGRLYQPAYGLGEYGGRKIIVRFNDVGPLRPGRKFDLSRAAMAYFDHTLDKGLLPDFKMTPLPLGRAYPVGPVTDGQLAALGIEQDLTAIACDDSPVEPVLYTASIAPAKAAAMARAEQVTPRPALRAPAAKPVKLAAAKPAAPAKVAAAKPAGPKAQSAEAAPAVTPWVRRLVNWLTSS